MPGLFFFSSSKPPKPTSPTIAIVCPLLVGTGTASVVFGSALSINPLMVFPRRKPAPAASNLMPVSLPPSLKAPTRRLRRLCFFLFFAIKFEFLKKFKRTHHQDYPLYGIRRKYFALPDRYYYSADQ